MKGLLINCLSGNKRVVLLLSTQQKSDRGGLNCWSQAVDPHLSAFSSVSMHWIVVEKLHQPFYYTRHRDRWNWLFANLTHVCQCTKESPYIIVCYKACDILYYYSSFIMLSLIFIVLFLQPAFLCMCCVCVCGCTEEYAQRNSSLPLCQVQLILRWGMCNSETEVKPEDRK